MGPIAQAVKDHFDEAGIRYAQPGDRPVFLASFALDAGPVTLVCDCLEERQQLVARVMFPFSAPRRSQAGVAELMARVNYRLAVGCFVTDFADGELSFRAGIDVQGDRLSPALARALVGLSLATANHFYPALAAVALGGVSPTQALAALEEEESQPPTRLDFIARGGLTVDPRDRLN